MEEVKIFLQYRNADKQRKTKIDGKKRKIVNFYQIKNAIRNDMLKLNIKDDRKFEQWRAKIDWKNFATVY